MSTSSSKPWVIWLPVVLVVAVISSGAMWYVMRPPAEVGGPEGAGGMPEMMGPPPASVLSAVVRQESLSQVQRITGRLREVRRARVASEVEGKILELPVEVGDRVVAGETLLARVDGVWADLDLESAEAEVASIMATLNQSRRDLEQLIQLEKTRSAVVKEVEDQRSDVEALEAALQAAKARRARMAQSVERLEVLAPFDGRVTAKYAEVGEWAELGSELVEIVSVGSIDAVVDVPEGLVNGLEMGGVIEVEIESTSEVVEGRLVAVSPDAMNAARTFPAKIRLDDGGGRLLAGMSVRARVPVGSREPVLLVSRDAVQFGSGTPTVWVAAEMPDQSMPAAMPVIVQVLFPTGADYAVRAAPGGPAGMPPMLFEGAQVVVQGAEWLFPTRPLMIQPAPTVAR
ncbi:MAG: efflux RND transporter periplasmic adaptor subunit [Phycisphaeraceae bacterium]